MVLAHVKRMLHHHAAASNQHHQQEWSRAYKVRIKKEFKVTDSGRTALSYGRILTPSHGASCGIRLKPGRRYLLTGTIRSGKPWINLCHFVHDWDRLTPTQRKGFRRLYAAGCDCKVMECHWWMAGQCPPTTQACYWETAFDWHDCQSSHAICTRTKTPSAGAPDEGNEKTWAAAASRRNGTNKTLPPLSTRRDVSMVHVPILPALQQQVTAAEIHRQESRRSWGFIIVHQRRRRQPILLIIIDPAEAVEQSQPASPQILIGGRPGVVFSGNP